MFIQSKIELFLCLKKSKIRTKYFIFTEWGISSNQCSHSRLLSIIYFRPLAFIWLPVISLPILCLLVTYQPCVIFHRSIRKEFSSHKMTKIPQRNYFHRELYNKNLWIQWHAYLVRQWPSKYLRGHNNIFLVGWKEKLREFLTFYKVHELFPILLILNFFSKIIILISASTTVTFCAIKVPSHTHVNQRDCST